MWSWSRPGRWHSNGLQSQTSNGTRYIYTHTHKFYHHLSNSIQYNYSCINFIIIIFPTVYNMSLCSVVSFRSCWSWISKDHIETQQTNPSWVCNTGAVQSPHVQLSLQDLATCNAGNPSPVHGYWQFNVSGPQHKCDWKVEAACRSVRLFRIPGRSPASLNRQSQGVGEI